MGTRFSRPLDYSCYEIAHTWTPSCSAGALDVGGSCLVESLKIYSSVYLIAEVAKGKVPSLERFKRLLLGIIQSSTFLSYNAFGFVWGHCFVRFLLGFSNFWTVAFLPGWLCSFLSILVEKKGRRGQLATYVTNVASESLFNSLHKKGLVPKMKYGDILLFSISTSILMFIYKKVSTTNEATFSILRKIIGKDEAYNNPEKENAPIRSPESNYSSKQKPSLYNIILHLKHPTCQHEHSCVVATTKSFIKPFMFGMGGKLLLTLYKIMKNTKLNHREPSSTGMASFGLPLFLGSFGLISKASLCALRWGQNKESPYNGLVAGFLGGLSISFYRNPSIALYSFWKSIEVLLSFLHSKGSLPTIPFFIEIIYATSTATLFHIATLEPHNLKKSYWKFLNQITGNKISEVNRILVDFEYNTQASKLIPFKPIYQPEHISDRLLSLLPVLGLI